MNFKRIFLYPLQFDIANWIVMNDQFRKYFVGSFSRADGLIYRVIALECIGWGVELSPQYFNGSLPIAKRIEIPNMFDLLEVR